MQIVIDIPEDVLKRTVFYREFRDLNDCVTTIKALEKAIPLPKGHGRLIDKDLIDSEFHNIFKKNGAKNIYEIIAYCLDHADTIIEADREKEQCNSTQEKSED